MRGLLASEFLEACGGVYWKDSATLERVVNIHLYAKKTEERWQKYGLKKCLNANGPSWKKHRCPQSPPVLCINEGNLRHQEELIYGKNPHQLLWILKENTFWNYLYHHYTLPNAHYIFSERFVNVIDRKGFVGAKKPHRHDPWSSSHSTSMAKWILELANGYSACRHESLEFKCCRVKFSSSCLICGHCPKVIMACLQSLLSRGISIKQEQQPQVK